MVIPDPLLLIFRDNSLFREVRYRPFDRFLRSPISPAPQYALFWSKLGTRDWNWERTEGKHGAPDRPPKSTIAPPLRSRLPSLSAALFLPTALSLPPFGPSHAFSLLIHLSICLSVYLRPPVLPLYRTPTSRGQLALGEHEYATPRSCRWILLCASTKEAQRGSGTHASILSNILRAHHTFHSESDHHWVRTECLKGLGLKVISATFVYFCPFKKTTIMWSILEGSVKKIPRGEVSLNGNLVLSFSTKILLCEICKKYYHRLAEMLYIANRRICASTSSASVNRSKCNFVHWLMSA